jgi:hypothetical protein
MHLFDDDFAGDAPAQGNLATGGHVHDQKRAAERRPRVEPDDVPPMEPEREQAPAESFTA